MKKILMPIVFVLLCLNTMGQKYSATFPKNINLQSQQLELRGTGTRVRLLMDMYTLGLYVKDVNQGDNPIVSNDEATVIRLNIVSRLLTSDKMVKAIQEGFERSTQKNTASIQTGIDVIGDLVFNNEIEKNDVFQFAYHPDKGTVVSKNGKQLASIKGYAFKNALWGVWFGQNPIDKKLKTKLLK